MASFGRSFRLVPRRISTLLVCLGLFAICTLFFTLPSSLPTGPSLSKSIADHKVPIPKIPSLKGWGKGSWSSSILNPFRVASHPPPVQKNSTYGESSWYSNWNWLSPFSSSVTLDENRALLPPLKERPPIYCYYDTTIQKDQATKDAESDLLLSWRRAWWAQGFKPIILSAAEAMNNPLYDELQRMELEPSFKTDLMRWLAYENMGGGLLAQYSLLPMGAYNDPLLSFLRRGDYPQLTRWEGFDDGLYAGSKNDITTVLSKALRSPVKKGPKNLIEAIDGDTFKVDPLHDGLAYYNAKTLQQTYAKVADELGANQAAGLKSLNLLINSHLHTTWQDAYPHGIAVLKPLPSHTTHMIEPAFRLAEWLAQCGDTPIPASCPPNLPKCSPCVASNPMKIATPARYDNKTKAYTIGTVPHPYTLASLHYLKDDIDVAWIRRKSERDLWLAQLTKELLGNGVSGNVRVVTFKDAVAGDAAAKSIWLTAEHESLPHDLDWYFGFSIPINGTDTGKSDGPVPGPERRPKPEHDPKDGPIPKPEEYEREPVLMKRAREIGHSEAPRDVQVRNAIEAWNLADTEAWRFTRAYLARTRVERLKWEEEESKYAGGAGSDKEKKRNTWGRWGE